VHEITDDSNEDSNEMSMTAQDAEASQTSATLDKGKELDNAGETGKLAELGSRRPQVLRFSPLLSTSEIDISLSGKTHFLF